MYFKRSLEQSLRGPTSRHKIRLLFGARQTGKTSLLQHALTPDATLLVNLAQPVQRRRYESDAGALTRELSALPHNITHVVVDEIQKVPALLDEVQAYYDNDKTHLQFFLTGSSARRLRQHSANLLPGRSHTYHLTPLTLWERADYNPIAELPTRPVAKPTFPRRPLEDVLLFGSLPGVSLESPDSAEATLAAYVETYLEEEIRREALVRDLGAFASFVRLAALYSGLPVNVARLSQDSGVPASTLKNYYQVLVDTFTGYWVEPYLRKAHDRLHKTPRFFLFDTGARNAAAGLPLKPGLLGREGPALFEHWVGLELLYRTQYLGRGYRVSYWRTHSGAEVDFVWESPDEDVPIEVKWTERPNPTDARHLERFLDEHKSRASRGLVVCRAPAPQRLTRRVLAVPWDRF